ncbi:MAG: gliding motility-associated C-terminal domain-containing protein, partial [Bacteroidota bacterium]
IDNPDTTTGQFQIALPFDRYSDTVFFKQTTTSCGMRADTLLVKLYEQPEEPVIYKGEQTILYIIDYDTLSASPPTAGNFEWRLLSEGAVINNPDQNPVLVENIPLENQTILQYAVTNGVCNPVSDQIAIDRREVNVYEGISPGNQDGLNDFLVAEGLDVEGARFTFQLFSTTGMLVREIKTENLSDLGYQTGLSNNGLELWDGRDRNGNNFVPKGTYYYVLTIEYKGLEFIDKDFVLVR